MGRIIFRKNAYSDGNGQLPLGFLQEHEFLLRRQFLFEKHTRELDLQIAQYISMSQIELREKFKSFSQGYLEATGLAKAISEPDDSRRRELILQVKQHWTGRAEEFDPRSAASSAFDGYQQWREDLMKKKLAETD